MTNLAIRKKVITYLADADDKKVMKSMQKIQAGQAISNLKEFKKGELFAIKQFKDRK